MLGVDELFYDEDGDIPIRSGSTMTFVSVIEPSDHVPFVRLMAPLVSNLTPNPELYEAVNAINLQVPFAKALVVEDGTRVVIEAAVLADTLSPAELGSMLELVIDAADYFDSAIKDRFGGDTLLEDVSDEIEV
jgi:hypothetical protein